MTRTIPDAIRSIPVVQGEYHISGDPNDMLTTLLGSCVAACLYDPVAKVGGMNHFLLPGTTDGGNSGLRYGAYAMELLINSLLKHGASRNGLRAKLFGGAKMNGSSGTIGADNAAFARWFLESEGIAIVGQDLGGARGRKLRFWPVGGRAQQMFMSDPAAILDQEAALAAKRNRRKEEAGDVLFL
jgi:chemotaxis protein CheD